MKSKLGRKLCKVFKPSTRNQDNEEQLNEEQKACNRLRQQSFYQFEDLNAEQDDNPFLKRNFRFHKVKTQMRSNCKQKRNANNSSLSKSDIKPQLRTLPFVNTDQKGQSNYSKSANNSPRKKLPLNLTQYIIVDSKKSQQTLIIKRPEHIFKHKYIKALQSPLKKIETRKKTALYFNFSVNSSKLKLLNINQQQKITKY